MKKIILFVLLLSLPVSSYAAPSSARNTPPKVGLIGGTTLHFEQGDNFVDPGYRAADQQDPGEKLIHSMTTSGINMNVPGNYVIRYRVTDTGGLYTEVFRNVVVNYPPLGPVELIVDNGDSEVNVSRVVQVDDSNDTNDVEILSFTLEAGGSDIYLNEISFDITSFGAGVTEILNDVRLVVGGVEVGLSTIDDPSSGPAGFDPSIDTTRKITVVGIDGVVIEEGEDVSLMLVADINNIIGAFSDGDHISVLLDADDIRARSENTQLLTADELSGGATSGPIEFFSTGIIVNVTSTPTPTQIINLPDIDSDNQGEFIMTFDVTAFEDDSWIELQAASSTSANADNVGVAFSIESATTGEAAQSGTTTALLSRISGGTVSGNFVRINSGQTARFRLTVYHDPAATGIYRVQMNEVGFNQTSAAEANQARILTPASDYQSASIQIVN